MYKTIEEAARELGFGDKVEYPWASFDIKWEALNNEELIALYNHYYAYVQEVEKQADDRENDKHSEALSIYNRIYDLLSDIIDEITYRADMLDEWESEFRNGDGQINTWNIFVKKAFLKIQ